MARTHLALPILTSISLLIACEREITTDRERRRSEALVGPCGLEISKIKYNQVGTDDGSLEAVELHAVSAPSGATLGSCGAERVGAWHQNDDGSCAPSDATLSIDVSHVVIPDDGFVLLGRGNSAIVPLPDAVTSQSTESWLPNGPDLVVVSGSDAALLALAIPKSGHYPTCVLSGLASPVIDLPDDEETGVESVEIACDEVFVIVPLSSSPFRSPNMCPRASMDAGATDGPPPTCSARFSKIDITMPRDPSAPLDAHQAVELEITGAFVPDVTTLAACGVATLSPFNANTTDASCGSFAAYYDEIAIDSLIIPDSGRVVIGDRAGAAIVWTTPSRSTFAVLQEGPDYVALRDATGAVVDALGYPSALAPTVYATCGVLAAASPIPADLDSIETIPRDQVLVRCDDGSWGYALDDASIWGAPTACHPPLVTALPPSNSDAGSPSADVALGEIPRDANASSANAGAPTADLGNTSSGCSIAAPQTQSSPRSLYAFASLLIALRASLRRPAPTPKEPRHAASRTRRSSTRAPRVRSPKQPK